MNRSRLLLLIPVLFISLVFSCKKTDDGQHNNVTPGGYASLEDVYAKTAPIARTSNVAVASGAWLFTTSGTRVEIPRDAFETYGGVPLTGSVQVTVNDWLLKGDMVFGRILPISYNEALYSSGQIFVGVTQNGVAVRLRDGVKISLHFPQGLSTTAGDSLYIGHVVTGSGNTINWLVDTGGIGAQTADTVTLTSDSLKYLSSAHFFPVVGYNNFTVRLNSPVTLEQTAAVALYDGSRTVYPIVNVTSGAVYAQRIPGGPMHVAVMGVKSGLFYGGIVPMTPANDSIYVVDMQQIDPQTFRIQMNSLN